ncbi:putative inactive disease susceptibility protein LOV1 [Salvia miltiorrhiza]|uniref:putative inactive disease susceptibility protein LOV1 n=1 Tax=Salvia miltiorrhiza TaxID=226208 RepID=UPI0025AB8EB8|nr:putative inactive disease susceptibility protein LOV1 [Salvia miltiorrhiza]
MSEALLLSVIQKLDEIKELEEYYNYWDTEYYSYPELEELLKSVIKEMRKIVDIVRDKKLEERRSPNFLVCDLVDVADDALYFLKLKQYSSFSSYYDTIHGWMGEIQKQMLNLGGDESNIRSSQNVEDDVDVVGLDEDVGILISKKIIGGGEDLNNILIKGMAGIGKTTLAREIFNHPTVVDRFERRAWVSNSTYFTMKELLIKLIQQLEDPQNLHAYSLLENMDNPSLRDTLYKHLQGKRYLIVLDDMRKQMRLRSFLNALPRENNGSRLVLTSHTMHSDILVYDENVHRMKPLDSNKSWQLFLKTINHGNKLTGDNKFPMDLQHMGKQMLRKCGGLPLAIKEVGKQLAEKKVSGQSKWEQLLESVDFGSTLKLLEPFYHKLDPKLRSCFLSMAFFKEDTSLRAEKLKQIWNVVGAAEEHTCESYLDGLINESVIDVNDKGTKYSMNIVLHMLSIQKAEEGFNFEILRNNGNNRPSESPRHHRVIICSRDKFNYSTDQDNHLVSLFFHGGGYLDTSPSYWKSFDRQLRILDLEDFGLKFLPESIGTLMELRYLGLRNNYLKELPESLRCLKKLEVLDIAQNFMVEVPNIIWELRSLCHLYLSDVICRKPLKIIGALWNLKTLTYISVDNWRYERLGKNMKFKKLGIVGLDGNSDVSKILVSLRQLSFINHLILRGYRFRSMPCLDELVILDNLRTLKLDGLLSRLPRFPPYIGSLTLVNSCLDKDPMPLLRNLPSLHYLKLRNAYTGQEMEILKHGFPKLRVLCMEELWNLRNVQCGQGRIQDLSPP